MKLSVMLVVAALTLAAVQPAQAKCGTRGGPGYRNQAGNCVSWEALARQCGNPPTTKCSAEQVDTGAADAAAYGTTIRSLMGRSREHKPSTDAARP
jgi:hypothetical protein